MEDFSPNLSNIAGPSQSIPATKDNKPSAGTLVDHPRDVDVVGTRRRTWSQHPGNVHYRNLVSKTLEELLERNDSTPMKFWATKVVDHVMIERDAVFLKADEQNGRWHVMDYAAAINKSAVAIRNAEIKQRGALTKKKSVKRKSGVSATVAKVVSNPSGTTHVQELPPIHYNKGPPPEKKIYRCIYEVKEAAAIPLDPYIKAIVNLMCAQFNSKAASRALDAPIAFIYKTAEEEPDKQRLFRLQLRQRYIAAMTIGMSPVFFSKKLMELWGGTISDRHVRIDKNGNIIEEVPPAPAVISAAKEINLDKKEISKVAEKAAKKRIDAPFSAADSTFPKASVEQPNEKLNEVEENKLGVVGSEVAAEKMADSSSQKVSPTKMVMALEKHNQGNTDSTSCSHALAATKGKQTEKERKGDREQEKTMATAKMNMGEAKYDQENKEVTTNLEKALAVADAAIDLEEALAAANVTPNREGAFIAAAQNEKRTENEAGGTATPVEAVAATPEDKSKRKKDASILEAAAAVAMKEEKKDKDVKHGSSMNKEVAVATAMTLDVESQTKVSNDESNVEQVEAANVDKKEDKTKIDGKDALTQDENKAPVKAEATVTDGDNTEAKPEDPSSVKKQADGKKKVEDTPPAEMQEKKEEEPASAVEKQNDSGNDKKEKVEDEPLITDTMKEKQEVSVSSREEPEHDNETEAVEENPFSVKVEEKEASLTQGEDDKEDVKGKEQLSVKMEKGEEPSRSNTPEKQDAKDGATSNEKSPVDMEDEEKEEHPRSTRKRMKQEDNDEVKAEDTSPIKTEEDAKMESPRSTRKRKKLGSGDSNEMATVEI